MFKNIVVGVDGHDGGRDAIALARQLTTPDGMLTLAHVYRYHPGSPLRGYDEDQAAGIGRARELLQAASEEARLPARLRWTGASSPGRGLHEMAETLRADLLIVGSTRRGLLGRVLSGDDTRAALDGAPCAVAIAPAGYADQSTGILRVGVGYDGSPGSESALSTARALASKLGASLAALEVVRVPDSRFRGPAAADSEKIEDLIDDARSRVTALGDDLEPHGAYGQPAEELAQWSASLDLLVVGSRSWGPVARLVHGSTSQELARRARCPLLVLTRPRSKATKPNEPLEDLELAGYPGD